MSWLSLRYQPVSLFSLRPANATTSGGRSLLVPTAFTFKMALLSTVIAQNNVAVGSERFPIIRDLHIALVLPESIVLLKSFAKIRRMAEFKDAKKREERIIELSDSKQYPFQSTIAYRELVQFGGPLTIIVGDDVHEPPAWLSEALLGVNYLGKRGSFFQPLSHPARTPTLPDNATLITQDSRAGGTISLDGTLQLLDDCGEAMTFAHADVYDAKAIRLHRERVLRHVILPYQLVQSSRGYSHYRYAPSVTSSE